jgi:hypothetical protein
VPEIAAFSVPFWYIPNAIDSVAPLLSEEQTAGLSPKMAQVLK